MILIYRRNNSENKKTKKYIPFKIVFKNITYLGTNLIKDVRDLYHDDFKSLKKDKEHFRKLKIFHTHEFEESILLSFLNYLNYYIDSI